MGKLPLKAGSNTGLITPQKPLVTIGELQCVCELQNSKNDWSNKKPYFDPLNTI